ncbi:MAG: class II glutamine amidotransferase [Gammaproteobacteria bacterium]
MGSPASGIVRRQKTLAATLCHSCRLAPGDSNKDMCRFVFYLGDSLPLADLVTRPENSLINQSVRARERPEPLNGDGFGLGWYVDGHAMPARFRSLTPAWSNANLDELARVTTSRCILAHVRAATGGNFDVAEANCHPFRCGRFAFMHNGHIPAFRRIRRPLMARLGNDGFHAIRGTTDTEHIFALVAERLRGHEDDSSCELLADALAGGIRDLHELIDEHAPGTHCYLNLVLTDGRHAAACRYSSDPGYIDSLYLNSGSAYLCDGDHCWMEPDAGTARAILVSSEPLNTGPRWQPVPRNHMALINHALEIELRSIGPY